MAHALLSVPMNLGLLDPLDVVRSAERKRHRGRSRMSIVEGFVRQVLGWRDYVWHLHWHFGPEYADHNALGARAELPAWWSQLRGEDDACPFTAGYWAWMSRHEQQLRNNPRLKQPLATMRKLPDIDDVREQEEHRRIR